jgi:hypothetical protein
MNTPIPPDPSLSETMNTLMWLAASEETEPEEEDEWYLYGI